MTKIVNPVLKENFIGAYHIIKTGLGRLGKVSVRRLALACGIAYPTAWRIAHEIKTGETNRALMERVVKNNGYKDRAEYEAASLARTAKRAGVSVEKFRRKRCEDDRKKRRAQLEKTGETLYGHNKKLAEKRAERAENKVFSEIVRAKTEGNFGEMTHLAQQLLVDRVMVREYALGYTMPRRSKMGFMLGVLGITQGEYQRRVEEERTRQSRT